jgi:hypothetical protein
MRAPEAVVPKLNALLKHRMDAARPVQGNDFNNLENQKAVSEAQQQAMRDLERETRAAVSAQLAAAFATPRVKQGLTCIMSHKKDLEQLIRRKWAVLQSGELRFGLDHTRTYPVLVAVPLLQNMGLSGLTFIPGKLPFPSITVGVELGAGGAFSVELIDGKLASVPPHIQRVLSEAGMLFLTLAVVVHSIDLFIVTEQQAARPVSPRQGGDGNSTAPSRSRNESLSMRIRAIPRRERTGVDAQSSRSHQRPQTSQVDPFRSRCTTRWAQGDTRWRGYDPHRFVIDGLSVQNHLPDGVDIEGRAGVHKAEVADFHEAIG